LATVDATVQTIGMPLLGTPWVRRTFSGDGGDKGPVEVQDDVDECSRLQSVGRHDAHEVAVERLVAEVLAGRRVADLRDVEQRQQVLHLHTDHHRPAAAR